MPASLTEKAYQKLTRDLGALLSEADRASNTKKTEGYWAVGERLAAEQLSEEAGYLAAVLRDISSELRISTRTLQRALSFHRAYQGGPPDSLSWAHYRILAPLPTKKERTFYERRAKTEGWSVRDLTAALRSDLYGGDTTESKALKRPNTPSYVYLARSPHLVDADTFDVDIDLGFNTWTHRRVRLAHIDAPEAGTKEGRAARDFVHTHLSRAQTLTIKSRKLDLHGRSLADVFLSPRRLDLDTCFEEGLYLNAALLEKGHAVLVG